MRSSIFTRCPALSLVRSAIELGLVSGNGRMFTRFPVTSSTPAASVGCRNSPYTQTGKPPATSTSRNVGCPSLVRNARTSVPSGSVASMAPFRSWKLRTTVEPVVVM